MPSSASASLDVPAPIEDAFLFLANLENAAVWWPYVFGAVNHVRPAAMRGDAAMCNGYPLPPSACDCADAPHPQQRHVARWLPDTPIKAGSRYRLLLSPPLAEVLHLCVVEWRPTSYAEWRGSSAARHLRLELALQRSPASPLAATYVQLRWTWEWRGWRRLKGALPAAHTAARAVGEQATARIAAAFAQALHLAYHPAEAPPTTPALLANVARRGGDARACRRSGASGHGARCGSDGRERTRIAGGDGSGRAGCAGRGHLEERL